MTFIASYEDVAKAEVAAAKKGWTKGESVLDYIEASDHETGRAFGTKDEAVAWLVDQIKANKSFFGSGEVVTLQQTPREHRCRYCICEGRRRISRAVVCDEGIEEEHDVDGCSGGSGL